MNTYISKLGGWGSNADFGTVSAKPPHIFMPSLKFSILCQPALGIASSETSVSPKITCSRISWADFLKCRFLGSSQTQ